MRSCRVESVIRGPATALARQLTLSTRAAASLSTLAVSRTAAFACSIGGATSGLSATGSPRRGEFSERSRSRRSGRDDRARYARSCRDPFHAETPVADEQPFAIPPASTRRVLHIARDRNRSASTVFASIVMLATRVDCQQRSVSSSAFGRHHKLRRVLFTDLRVRSIVDGRASTPATAPRSRGDRRPAPCVQDLS